MVLCCTFSWNKPFPKAPPVIDIGELCCWVSDMLRGSAPHARIAMPEGMQQEIGGRFGVHEEDASNNLFGWLLRLQRAGPHNANGALLDPNALQAPGRGDRVCPAVARYVYAQLGGQAGALAWLQDAQALGFDTAAGYQGHSRGGSDASQSSPDSAASRSPAQRRYDSCLARVCFVFCAARVPYILQRLVNISLTQARNAEALATRVREQAILVHVVYDGKQAVVSDEAGEGGLSDDELEASLQLPSAVLQRCVATAARVVKHYLAHELPAKYQH